MSDQYSCEFCSNYVYDEEYEEYGCVVNMDEDDLAMLMQFKRPTAPYFSYGDEYRYCKKTVELFRRKNETGKLYKNNRSC